MEEFDERWIVLVMLLQANFRGMCCAALFVTYYATYVEEKNHRRFRWSADIDSLSAPSFGSRVQKIARQLYC